ncbi:LPS-assembly lipoprotein LptE [Agarivorans sp. MS3-6]|uniref:LPS-assembly lipoprotein LptE n=1 Tax=Agarivorans sp. TSD2052 TaxID=2937286 RepID=UPI00200C58C3|nr:LPS assembly lipoprotein LptE [Agarivorans sp. TSD2052]UPW19896.1 LPS assembly lipoprotein LptE [Agarivorans sp. TSD2052]
MNYKIASVGFIALCLSLLTACGFAPRGSYLLDEKLTQIYVSSSDEFSPLVRELKRQLSQNNVAVFEFPQDDIPTLHIGGENISKRTLSLFDNGQVAEYELSYQVAGYLQIAEQGNFPINVQLHRDFQDNPLAALAKQRERELLYSELRVMASDQIMRQLATVSW